MKHSSDFYKVVNAVINTLRQGNSVAYVTGGNGGSGFGLFSPNEDFDDIRNSLLSYDDCEELEDEEILADFDNELDGDKGDYVFWQLSEYGTQNPPMIQLAIVEDYYCDPGTLAELIADEQDLESAEVTQGTNGYPRGLYDVVLLKDSSLSFEQMEELADKYGVQVLSLKRKDGWQLWESEGSAYELYDYAEFMEQHDDNVVTFDSFKAYANYLRETAYELKDSNIVAEMAARAELDALADEVEKKDIKDNEFVWINTYDIKRYETDRRKVSSFSYDSSYHTLALDCSII